jgi:uncharacterized membrane protein
MAPTAGTKKSSGGGKNSGTAAKTKKSSKTATKAKASSNGSRSNGAAKSATKKAAKSATKKAAPKKSSKAAATGAAAQSVMTTRPGGNVRLKMATAAVKAAAKKAGERAKDALPMLSDGPRAALDNVSWDRVAERVRTVPVQQSVDIAVPIEAAWDEWMRFDWMPDGAHRVTDIERDGDLLFGEIAGAGVARDWEAEITDERTDESFAWLTTEGSDTSGLVTFHSLADRLTRIELQLDIVPVGPGDALALLLRRSDRHAQNVLRNFKAQVEALDPDEYPDVAEVEEDQEEEAEPEETEEAEEPEEQEVD